MRPRGSLRRDLELSIGDTSAYGVMVGIGETYLPAFALAMGISPVLAGLVATVPLLAGGILQLLAPRALPRVGNYRRWVVGCASAQAFAFVPLAVGAALGHAPAWLVFASASLYWAAGMAASAGWNGWMARLVPVEVRGRFFGRRQSFNQAALLVGLVGGGAALHLTRGSGDYRFAFAAMFAVAALARLTSAILLSRHGVGADVTPRRPMRLRSVAPRIRNTPRAELIGYMVCAFAATSLAGPFLTPFLLGQQHLSYAAYTAFIATVAITKVVALPRIGELIKKFGPRRVLTYGALGIAPLPLLWPLSPNLAYLIAMQVVAGVIWAAFELASFMILFDVDDEDQRTTTQVAFSGLQSMAIAGASILGGVLLASLGTDFRAYVIVFVASAAARLTAVLVLVRRLPRFPVHVPMAATRAIIVALRPWGGTILRPLMDGFERLRPGRWRGAPSELLDDDSGDFEVEMGPPRPPAAGTADDP